MKMRSTTAMVVWMGLFVFLSPGRAAQDELVLVPEMQRPSGILFDSAARRNELESRPESKRALELLRKRVEQLWPRLREVDLVALSRYQIEATRSFRLPPEPGGFEARIVGRDEKDGRLFLELRGPRLPARHAIVYRYLYLYCSFE